jgi:hypothetical protein
MIESRIVESMKEAVAISRGELPGETYKIHIPEQIDVKPYVNEWACPSQHLPTALG